MQVKVKVINKLMVMVMYGMSMVHFVYALRRQRHDLFSFVVFSVLLLTFLNKGK